MLTPNSTYLDDAQNLGSSWTSPIKNLRDALSKIGTDVKTIMADATFDVAEIHVHVKEGTVDMSGVLSTGSVRSGSLVIPDVTYTRNSIEHHPILKIMGGYDKSLDYVASRGTSDDNDEYRKKHDLSKRNPILTPTVITGKVLNDYKYYIPHLVKIDGKRNVTIDGFQLRYANARSQELLSSPLPSTGGAGGGSGAAFTINNSQDITIKNVLVAGCTADNGAAVYAADHSAVSFENCIFHNNETTYTETSGNVFCDATSSLTLNHCDILRNVGYAFYNLGTLTMNNSIVYANMSIPVVDTNSASDKALVSFKGTGTYTGSHNLFDIKSKDVADANTMYIEPWLQFNFDGGSNNNYPFFVNSTKNAGVSVDGDATYYGRGVNWQPHNGSPMVNNANTGGIAHAASTSSDCWGTDMSTVINRDYGGLPDIGAVECHAEMTGEGEQAYSDGQRAYGSLFYVCDYNGDLTKGGDGSSWTNAINGNAYYNEETGMFLGADQSKEVEGETVWISGGTTKAIGTYSTTPMLTSSITSSTKNLMKIRFGTEDKYLKVTSNAASIVTTAAEGSDFLIIGTMTSNVKIYCPDANAYITWNTSKLAVNSTGTNAWKVASGVFSYSYSGKTYYLRYNNSSVATGTTKSNYTWYFAPVTITTTEGHYETVTKTVTGINGLQYAVNKASRIFADDNVFTEVWVAAGTYAKDPETSSGLFTIDAPSTSSGQAHDESCFIIRDGVNVYGAFPKTGNPGKEQREALLSQYVKKRSDKSRYNIEDYETILEPISRTPEIGKVRRVLGQPYANNPANTSYTTYNGAKWDGFTIRYGNIDASKILTSQGNGGAGATVYHNVTLKNCVVTNNTIFAPNGSMSHGDGYRGGGMVVRGGTVEECYFINNTMTDTESSTSITSSTGKSGVAYGGGLYFNSGTIYNCVVSNNHIVAQYADGAGFFIDGAVNCYNNTVVNNKAEGTARACGGIDVWTSNPTQSNLQIFNTIIVNNDGFTGQLIGTKDVSIANRGGITLTNCYSESKENKTDAGNSSYITYNNCIDTAVQHATDNFTFLGSSTSSFADLDLRLKANSKSINVGLDTPTLEDGTVVDLTTYTDMDYTERVQDCTIDIGAYEYNNAYAISPTVDGNVASYYVTPNGKGTASATNPANAACAAKLQKVIDAAGRYKFSNPDKQVIVKVANSKTMEDAGTPFNYYANRTTDNSDQDIRVWAIDIPRGVEVWGGYSDDDDFAVRDILTNPTYFDAAYYNKTEKQAATCYHVVSFSRKVYDGDGVTYKVGDEERIANNEKASQDGEAMLLGEEYGRAVIDGIFIQGGKADIASSSSGAMVNKNQYGGAAIVTDYAHVRNCIATDNQGKYGGAFAVTNGALISGTLVTKNRANYGGAVYVFENGTKLSDGTVINTGTDYKSKDQMPHIYTSTIVNNKAEKQGGGLWFTDDYSNVRVNSTVLWQNHCNDEANVYGLYSPEKADDQKSVSAEAFFPFAYSAIQNMRVSGTNNLSVETSNANGMRIWKQVSSGSPAGDTDMATDQSAFSDFGYWRPTSYSVLLNTGMPVSTYETLKITAGLAATDFATTDRLVSDNGYRTYVDIGARALMKPRPTGQLMLRLFVAKPEDVDIEAASAMMALNPEEAGITATEKSIRTYYKQEGSSFAYPFQNLQDALDYVVWARSARMQSNYSEMLSKTKDLDKAVDVPFEIFVAKGEYFPTKDLVGNYGESLSNTFAIPEGVSIYGGFDCLGLKNYTGADAPTGVDLTNAFFGGYYAPKATVTHRVGNDPFSLKDNIIAPLDAGIGVTSQLVTFGNYKVLLSPTEKITALRPKEDINKNSIVEPWEFQNQTILSGNTTNENADGVYHVVSILPDENIVGQLPEVYSPAGYNYYVPYTGDGYQPYETGQDVVLNGLTISGGYAENYKIGQMKDELSEYIYFKGGGLVADGNRYNNSYNLAADKSTWTKTETTGYQHDNITNNVAYHNVPIYIMNCKFRDNVAGFGGAIASNCEMLVYGSSFENNLVRAGSDTFHKFDSSESVTVEYPGIGGAIANSYQFSAYNTLFANNEAQDSRNTLELKGYKTYNNQSPSANMLGGAGGAMYFGKHGFFHIFNCDIVRNKANAYPAIFTANPNYLKTGWNDGSVVCMPGEYNLIENTVLWGNELNASISGTDAQKFAATLICNVGKKNRTTDYSPAFTDGNIPTAASQLTHESDWMETAWFCAYEDGRGFTATNGKDMRALNLDPTKHIVSQLKVSSLGEASAEPVEADAAYQNCNIIIDSENATLEGPNFGNPSQTAGNNGYREDSDWSPSRICNLTDNGSGKLDQTNVDGEMKYVADANGVYPGSGTYWTAYYQQINDNTSTLPIGNDPYMKGTGTGLDILRISLDPNPTHNESYVDIGVYEYVHTKLEPTTIGDEVDILWVSNEEKYGNGVPDGKTWAQPTSDLQRAIETLLASRNGHRKEIRLMEGEYSPVYTINGHQSFYIDTKYLNASVELPKDNNGNLIEGQGVKSFTIKGGYSKDLMNQYDVTLYPSVIKTKTRSNSTEDDWDHAIYIADASQRYGIKTGYEAANGFGWWETEAKQQSKPTPTTVPIQIDGVSVVNNQALNNTKGAAIYYADQAFNANGEQEDGATAYLAVAPVDAHVTTAGTTDETAGHTYATKTAPAKLILSKTHVYDSGANDGSKDVSAVYIGKYGGEALIYNNVFHSNYGDPLVAYAAKTINNTYALNGGKVDLKNATGNTTYDNAHPYKSTILNSVLWRNNPVSDASVLTASDFGQQFALEGLTLTDGREELKTCGTIFAYNAYTGGNTEAVDYDDAEQFIGTHNHNVGLMNGNSDAIYGPNFADPENADVSKRSFKLLPSLRLLNKGSNAIYTNITAYVSHPEGEGQGGASYAWVPNTMLDAAGQYRIMVKTGGVIDIGALEYQTQQNRILYVDPSKTLSGEGLSWGDALGYGNIQAAIDLAAVYYKNMHKEAYVFVKAAPATNKDMHTGETITLRNGVSIYGSVSSDYKTNCVSSTDGSGNVSYAESDIADFVKDVTIYNRGGIINPSSGQTRINGINTNGTAFDNTPTCLDDGDANKKLPTALVDGFVVTNAEAVKAPVIKIAPKIDDTHEAEGGLKMCLRNIAVYGNDYSGGEEGNTVNPNNNLVDINSALLYEVLMHSNKVKGDDATASILKVRDHGYVVNATVEGKTTGADGSTTLNNVGSASVGSGSAISDNTASSHVYNSITNYVTHEATWKTLSGYCYKMEDQNLNYQLTENSKYIDACGTSNPMADANLVTTEADRNALQGFINYVPVYEGTKASGKWTSADKDLLGNFRLQTLGTKVEGAHSPLGESEGASVDRGAFETWKVVRSAECVYPDYPHDGSVEYIMQGKSLIIDPLDGDNRATAHVPGFILLQEGASLYGNGRPVHASYVALERKVNKIGSVVAMPHSMDYVKSQVLTADANTTVGVATRTYDEITGIMSMTNDNGNVWQYDGSKRSDWKYAFASSNSPCWKAVSEGTVIPGAQGVLYEPSNTYNGTEVLRFTYRGNSLSNYIYKEESSRVSGDASASAAGDRHYYQTVTLKKYDDSESTSGAADFTEAEDQGWNCIGIPYLVNGYSTMGTASAEATVHGTSASGKYMMQNPHTMWLYYDGKKYSDGTTAANGDGGFYSVSSWDASDWHVSLPEGEDQGGAIWAGEGFFVQNQKFSGDEALTFYRPVAPTLSGTAHAKPASRADEYNTRYYYSTDLVAPADDGNDHTYLIRVVNHTLYVGNLEGGEFIRLYTTAGQLLMADTAINETYTTDVTPGIIIVNVNGVSKKVWVK